MSADWTTKVEIELAGPPPQRGSRLLVPRPVDHWGAAFATFAARGLTAIEELGAANSPQRAYVIEPDVAAEASPRLTYRFRNVPCPPSPWVWQVEDNRFTTASQRLAEMAATTVPAQGSPREKLRALAECAAELFSYGHVEQPFNEGASEVPAICDRVQGSCVDINTFLLAAARTVGIRGQYVAGYWFHPQKTQTHDMHCWLAFDVGEKEPVFWDVAHHLKWGVAGFSENLNPAGGRRVPMSFGRGLRFETGDGSVTRSHFSEPVWLLPDGTTIEPEIVAQITERDPAAA